MALAPGTRLGVYEVTAQIGAGGMGEVYRARDTRLDREVALKVLPELFVSDPERVARFQREAKTLASLNHPNIGGIYGLEEANPSPGSGQAAVTALVMELVEGEDLAQRIARGAIPLDDALPIAKQIAEALEAAHETGIIHRDLKPGNVKVRPDGTVKVLDFGLAKAMEPVGSAPNVSRSPTITTPAMTQAGIILGTAAYMSPEQARGKPVDRRADIWAFGVVLFEMLTGRRAFEGDDISITLAAVMMKEPAWDALPAPTPMGLRRLLTRCLKKDPKTRMRDIGDARLQIEELLSGSLEDAGVSPIMPPALSFWQRALPWSVAAAALVGVAVAIALWAPWRKASLLAPLRLNAELGTDLSLTIGPGAAAILSPDGAVLVFVAQKSGAGNPQLYVRRLDQLQANPLAGTDEAESPFFSPDGQWIAFFAGGKLKKVAVTGGAAVTLCDAPNGRGGTWGDDGTIVFSPTALPGASLVRVSSGGGKAEPLIAFAQGEIQRWPQFLPGGKALLYTVTGLPGTEPNIMMQPLPSGSKKVVQRAAYHGRYLLSGHLAYIHDGILFAAPFDLARLALAGQPVPAVEGVASSELTRGAQFAVSDSGTLVYLPGAITGGGIPLHWMDHDGKTTPLRATLAPWLNSVFAPDGRRLALQIIDGQSDIWVYEWARDTLTRLTSDPANDSKPVWTPDGRGILFASTRADQSTSNLYWQRADGTGDAQRLTESKNQQRAASWHPSGRFVAFEETTVQPNGDLMILPIEGNDASGWKPGKPTVFLNSPANEREPMFSPDGRWLAYSSNESGRDEVSVRPFPGPGGRWQISTGGGTFPTWSRAKHELLYATPGGQIMVTPFTAEGDSFRAEKPRPWAEGHYETRGPNRMFDLHPDGERVALAPAAQTGRVKQDKVVFVFNFFEELRRIAPRSP